MKLASYMPAGKSAFGVVSGDGVITLNDRLRERHASTDYRAVEERSYRETGVFPIMHLVTLRADVYARHPWIAMNLLTAFEAAKQRSVARALDTNAPCFPVPWGPAHELIGEDFWPYGIEANRRTLETFLQLAFEQGVCVRKLTAEELFVPEVQQAYRV